VGRGRAKAKQTKVARQLKYQSLDTDFGALQRELSGSGDSSFDGGSFDESTPYDDGEADPYAVDPYAVEDEDEDARSPR
jgi:hypothetical protein